MSRPSILVQAGDERGITLLELLVALALFAVIAIGTLAALGATNTGGFLEGFPVAFATSRSAKDITAATVYVQGLQEHLAKLGASLAPGTYTSPTGFGYAEPSSAPYQLGSTTLAIVIERWGWNPSAGGGTGQYEGMPGCTADCLFRVHTTLGWQVKDATRTVAMQRFIRP
jgi:prepilin-type N-terminal cleavage/methylation domain-containing protein